MLLPLFPKGLIIRIRGRGHSKEKEGLRKGNLMTEGLRKNL